MAEPSDRIAPLLREMRTEMRMRFADVHAHLDGIDRRLAAVEKEQATLDLALGARRALRNLVTARLRSRLDVLECRIGRVEVKGAAGVSLPGNC